MASTSNTTQVALGADVASKLYGVTGAGIKIGIISDSYNAKGGAAADMAAGILPNVTVLSDSAGSDEGRAMIEIANSVAPGATYYTADGGSLAANVTALQNAGVTIIIDDLSVGGEAFYQIGSATDVAMQAAVAAGIDYFTSAGNNGNAYYEQGFAPVTTTIAGIGTVTANDFGGGSPYLSLTLPANFKTNLQFQFAQPFGSFGTGANSPTNSLAIYLLDSSGTVVASSTDNDVGGDPVQTINFDNTTANTAYRLVVTQNGGTVPAGELFKFFLNDGNGTINSPNAGKGSGDLLGHEFLPGINVVGSVAYTNTPAFGVSPSVIEAGSSVGPGAILFDAQGNRLATPIVPNEPQFEATDGTLAGAANTTFATDPFFGTSAAAPAAGAVAALVLQADGKLSTTQITSVLAQSVIPVTGQTGYSGAGLIQARAAVEIAAADAGDRWDKAASNNWVDSARWSKGAAPTNKEAVSLDDNLGAFTGKYTVTVDSSGNRAGSLAIAAPAGSEATLDVAAGGVLDIGGPKAGDITAGDFLVSDNGRLRVTGGTLKVSGSLNVNNGVADIASGLAEANNYAQDAGLLTLGGSGKAATLKLTGTGFEETGGKTFFRSDAIFDTKSLSDSAGSFLITAANAVVKDTGAASFTNKAIFEDKGTFEDTASAASKAAVTFNNTTVTDDGSFTAQTTSLTQSTFTDKGSWIDKGALSFDDTTGKVDRGGSIEAASLSVGATSAGFGNTLTDDGTITDKGDLGYGASGNGGTVAVGSSGTLIVGGTVNNNVKLAFIGNGVMDFGSSSAATLTTQLNATIDGFKAGSGKIDFSGLLFKADDSYFYDSKTGILDIENPNTVLANVYLDKSNNYTGGLNSGGFNLRADASNHVEITVAPTRMA